MNQMMKPPMPKKKKSKTRQMMSGRDGNSAMMDTAKQTKMNEMMKKRMDKDKRTGPKEPVEGMKAGGKLDMVEKDGKKVPFYAADGKGKMKAGGKVKNYKSGGKVRGAGMAKKGVRPCKMR